MTNQLPILTESSLEVASKIFKAEADARRALYDVTGIKPSARTVTHAADRETRNAIYKAAVAQTGKGHGEEFVETPEDAIRRRYREVRSGNTPRAAWSQHGLQFAFEAHGRIVISTDDRSRLDESAEIAIQQAIQFVARYAPKPKVTGRRWADGSTRDDLGNVMQGWIPDINHAKWLQTHCPGCGSGERYVCKDDCPRLEIKARKRGMTVAEYHAEGERLFRPPIDELAEIKPEHWAALQQMIDAGATPRAPMFKKVAEFDLGGRKFTEIEVNLGMSDRCEHCGLPNFDTHKCPSPELRKLWADREVFVSIQAEREARKTAKPELTRCGHCRTEFETDRLAMAHLAKCGPASHKAAFATEHVASALRTERALDFDRGHHDTILTTPPPHMRLA